MSSKGNKGRTVDSRERADHEIEPTFENLLVTRERFSYGLIGAHRNVQTKEDKTETSFYDQKLKRGEIDSKTAQFEKVKIKEQLQIRNAAENKKRERVLVSNIRNQGFDGFSINTIFEENTEKLFWIWGEANPEASSEQLLSFLKDHAAKLGQDSFVYMPFERPALCYRKDWDMDEEWEGNWISEEIPEDIDFISELKDVRQLAEVFESEEPESTSIGDSEAHVTEKKGIRQKSRTLSESFRRFMLMVRIERHYFFKNSKPRRPDTGRMTIVGTSADNGVGFSSWLASEMRRRSEKRKEEIFRFVHDIEEKNDRAISVDESIKLADELYDSETPLNEATRQRILRQFPRKEADPPPPSVPSYSRSTNFNIPHGGEFGVISAYRNVPNKRERNKLARLKKKIKKSNSESYTEEQEIARLYSNMQMRNAPQNRDRTERLEDILSKEGFERYEITALSENTVETSFLIYDKYFTGLTALSAGPSVVNELDTLALNFLKKQSVAFEQFSFFYKSHGKKEPFFEYRREMKEGKWTGSWERDSRGFVSKFDDIERLLANRRSADYTRLTGIEEDSYSNFEVAEIVGPIEARPLLWMAAPALAKGYFSMKLYRDDYTMKFLSAIAEERHINTQQYEMAFRALSTVQRDLGRISRFFISLLFRKKRHKNE